jgi:type II secretory pathway pseudopilin PulG
MRIELGKKHSNLSGFTLIEALVSAALFATFMVAVTSAFTYTTKLNRRTNAVRVANDNARYITEFLSKEIRNGRINFGNSTNLGPCNYSTITASDHLLYMTNVNGDSECFYLGDSSGVVSSTGPVLWLRIQPSGSSSQYLSNINQIPPSSGGVYNKVTSLNFIVQPAQSSIIQNTDPTHKQPQVTIEGTLVSSQDPQDIITVPFQTTISIPEYDVPRS